MVFFLPIRLIRNSTVKIAARLMVTALVLGLPGTSIAANDKLDKCVAEFNETLVGEWEWSNHWITGTGIHGKGAFVQGRGTASVIEVKPGIFKMNVAGETNLGPISMESVYEGKATSPTKNKNSIFGDNSLTVYTRVCHLRDDGSYILVSGSVSIAGNTGNLREAEVHDFKVGDKWHRVWRSRPAGSEIPFSTWASWIAEKKK
tara:strand:- start:224 stop:832 length:609 start_codon:yes stop_codon:yes gene_type:complete